MVFDMDKNSRKQTAIKWGKRLLLVGIAVCLCVVSFMLGGINAYLDDPRIDEHIKARYALEETGLSDSFEPEFVIHGSQTGRDFYIQTLFNVRFLDDREAMMKQIQQTEGWTVDVFSAEDYRNFIDVTWYPGLNSNLIADGIEFDAWFYKVTTPPAGYEPTPTGYFSSIGQVGRGFCFAAYDVDTGLFIFIDQFG